jgi:hypothetical protein
MKAIEQKGCTMLRFAYMHGIRNTNVDGAGKADKDKSHQKQPVRTT